MWPWFPHRLEQPWPMYPSCRGLQQCPMKNTHDFMLLNVGQLSVAQTIVLWECLFLSLLIPMFFDVHIEHVVPIWRFHKIFSYPQFSSISISLGFSIKKPSSFWGTPMTMETSICQGHHESSASIGPVGYPTSWKPSESSMAVDFSFVWVTRDHFTNKKWAGFCVCVWKMLVSTGDGK